MAEAPDSFQAQHVHPHQGAQQVLAPAKEKMSPSAQLEKYGFNIDESLATSYVGKYTLYHTIGQGAFGKVKVAVCKYTGEVFAIKIMDKHQILKQDFTSQVRREIYIMRSLKHKHIVRMHEVLSSESKLYIVMDYVRGGELFHKLEKNGRVMEHLARLYFQQLVDGVDFCHRSGVAHRDLKPENLLLDENGNIQITDFGFSSMRGVDVNADLLHTQCGTPDYCAPEIIEGSPKGYSGAKVDAWSCGIILYALLAGRLPFVEQDTEKLYDLILACKVDYPKWITPGARDLLQHLLIRNPVKRYGLQQVKSHPWFLIDYDGDDARLLKKRPFFNKNQRTPVHSANPVSRDAVSVHSTAGSDHEPRTKLPSSVFVEHEESNSIGEELGHVRSGIGARCPNSARGRDTHPELEAHIRAPTPPIHAVLTRVEVRPVTPGFGKSNATYFKCERSANDLQAERMAVANCEPPNVYPLQAASIRARSGVSTTCVPSTPSTASTAAASLTSNGHCEVKPPVGRRNSEPLETVNGSGDDSSASDGNDSIEDYQDKPVPELELPKEPIFFNRVRPTQSQRDRSHQTAGSDQLPPQRHRSDVSDRIVSRSAQYPPSALETVSLSALPRRKLTAAPSNDIREPRGLRLVRKSDLKPNSPLMASTVFGSHPVAERVDPASPSFNSRQLNAPTVLPKSRVQPNLSESRSGPWREPGTKTSSPYMLHTETCARHIWNIVSKWRGFQEPMSPSSSLDVLSDFRVLQSEMTSFQVEDKAVVLDRFLGLFEAYGLSELQSMQSSSLVYRGRHRGPTDEDVDEDTGTAQVQESDNHQVSFSQRRLQKEISSEEETLSWSPVLVDSQRQQSDLARRREMSDLLNKWILKTGNQSSVQQARSPAPPLPIPDDEVSSTMDISELQRLMRQHQSGREESNLADELYKLMHPEPIDETGNGLFGSSVFQSGQSPSSPTLQGTQPPEASVQANRRPGASQNRAGLRQASSPYCQAHVELVQTRRGDGQSAAAGCLDGYGEKSNASIGTSSENNSYAAIALSPALRNRPNMATSMGMHDVEYYGPQRKGGMATKIRGALLTMKARNQKLAEGLSQFKSSLPTEDVIRIIVAILQNFGATTLQLKRETKRKLKCKVHIHDDHYLCAAIEFSNAENSQGTVVVFKRSKEDRGRTDVASFHEFYENVRERFIAEVQTRYDRGNRNITTRKRSARTIGGSFG